MGRKWADLSGFAAFLDVNDVDGEITAGYLEDDTDNILDAITYIVREEEHGEDERGKYVIPEETEIDRDMWQVYYDRLADWVSDETGIDRESLDEAQHPDVVEPFIRFMPEK